MVDDGIDLPGLAAGGGIDGVQAAVDRRHVHPPLPDRDATVDEVAAGIACIEALGLRIVAPAFTAGRRVHRVDDAPGARGVHHAVDDDRRSLLATLRLAEVVVPRVAELLHVRLIDLRQRRIVAAAPVAPAGEPAAGFRVGMQQARHVDAARLRRLRRRAGARGSVGGACRSGSRDHQPFADRTHLHDSPACTARPGPCASRFDLYLAPD